MWQNEDLCKALICKAFYYYGTSAVQLEEKTNWTLNYTLLTDKTPTCECKTFNLKIHYNAGNGFQFL